MLYYSSVFIIIASNQIFNPVASKINSIYQETKKIHFKFLLTLAPIFPQLVLENISYNSYDEFHY